MKVAEGYSPEFYAGGVLVHNCTWTPTSESPDRMDALVWILTKLMIGIRPRRPVRTSVAKGRLPGVDRYHPGGI